MAKVLVIGDIHEPFCLDGYLEFCREKNRKLKPDRIVFIGDVVDNHYSSYHETDADGMGGADELDLAIKKLKRWYKAFPKADVIIGNHDRMVMRKAQTSNVPSRWIREYSEVLGTPGWKFSDRVVIDEVQYIHGEGGQAKTRAVRDMQSTVQGHIHTEAYVQHFAGENRRILAVQVGCGIDRHAYAMAYAKNFKHPFISCALVHGGELATIYPMKLRNKI